MRFCRGAFLLSAGVIGATFGPMSARAQGLPAANMQRDGSIQIAGHALRCGSVRTVVDNRLPNLGAAGPGVLVMNSRLLQREPATVRLFVFHHECGHHHRGASELAADCWAVEQGVRDQWLDGNGLKQVCGSFNNAPETPTHPSGERRCRNLDRCFRTATSAGVQAANATPPAASSVRSRTAFEPIPKLVSGPSLVRSGTVRSAAPDGSD